MGIVNQLFRSKSGFVSPYFVVDGAGNLLTQTITVTGNRLELTKNSYVSYNGAPLLTGTELGSSVTKINGVIEGLTVAGDINITGNINIQGAVNQGGPVSNATGEINNVNLGTLTPGNGNFKTLTSTGISAVSFTNTGTVSISPTGAVAISPTGTVSISPTGAVNLGTLGQAVNLIGNLTANDGQNISIALTGTGTVAISSAVTGNIDNINIGTTTAAQGNFTFARLTANNELFNEDVTQVATKRYVEAAMIMGYFAGVSAR